MTAKTEQLPLATAPETALAVRDTRPPALIAQAIDGGATPETIAQLLELQLRWEANEARKAYHHAMSAFKASAPRIVKDKTVSYSGTSYKHATLANVTNTINQALARHGLTAQWHTENVDGMIAVTCTITHELGHSESTSLSGRPDDSGKKNAIQQVGSTVTYLQRYTLLALTGLATQDSDDDAGAGPLTDEEFSGYMDEIQRLQMNEPKLLRYLGLDTLADLSRSDVPKLKSAFTAQRRYLEEKEARQ